MRNISRTFILGHGQRKLLARHIAATAALLGALGWAGWTTRTLIEVRERQVVSVQLSRLMKDYVETEARGRETPQAMRAGVAAYLTAVEASVAALARSGRTVLVAEAVVSGGGKDMTEAVRADVAARMKALDRAAR